MAGEPERKADLRSYVLAKQEVVGVVLDAADALAALGAAEATARCRDLLVRLAEDRFNLAVVGQFKRGKSTLMNAIIGRDLLPTGVLPLTSAVTALCYGPRERVILRREGWVLEQEIQLDALADYVTERGNPGNEKAVIEARIELPVPFLRRGLHFIDTPGVGSTRLENTATTLEFLPQADAVIFVTSIEAPLSEAEGLFLRDVRDHVRRLLVIVNKIDLLDEEERDEVVGYVRSRLVASLVVDTIPIFPLSARGALDAKLRRDPSALRLSGLTDFEAALTTFLADEQGRTFLVHILDRLLAIIDEQAGGFAEAVGGRPTSPSAALGLRDRIAGIRDRLLSGGPLVLEGEGEPVADTGTQALERSVAASGRRPTRGGGTRMARAATCPVCAAQGDAIFDFFATWQYQLATDKDAQREFAAARGFCPAHSWQFGQIASQQGVSAGYAPLIESTARELRRLLDGEPDVAAARLAALMPTARDCAACRVLEKTEGEALAQLLERLASPDGEEPVDTADGLCLPHLQAALAVEPGGGLGEWLVADQVRRLEELAEDMHGYSLKREARRRGLLSDGEEHAWRRALVQLVGERVARGIVLPGEGRM